MKIIETNSFKKIAGKIPESQLEPYNPFAVCHSRIDKKKNPDKWERCVMDIKDKNKEDNTKPAMEGEVYSPKNEDEYLSKNKGKLHRKAVPKKQENNWDEVMRKMRKTKYDPQYAKSKENLKK